ncbi:hypothetical protein PV379_04570 [Streptomyces caniscabiei]|uniref:putative immunity protein n=1 Tax=Streptomyces caniscabiei TaxID=2746961 RepID=UPI0029A43069|nr:hypothetical protein [Streptomyces caniscabiei]MDX2776610.1 hypothetical protein [Streptomyces caniscabiei]
MTELKSSTEEQERLRAVALWAVAAMERVLPVFERRYPENALPRDAVEAARAFGAGGRRDKRLRVLSLAVFKLGKDVDEASKYITKAASATAAVAYTHTDLQSGTQGVRQAQHILGPVVYAAFALEIEAGGDAAISAAMVHEEARIAPSEVRSILMHVPPQPKKAGRLNELFFQLDSEIRSQ